MGLHYKAHLQHAEEIHPEIWLQTQTFQSKGFP